MERIATTVALLLMAACVSRPSACQGGPTPINPIPQRPAILTPGGEQPADNHDER